MKTIFRFTVLVFVIGILVSCGGNGKGLSIPSVERITINALTGSEYDLPEGFIPDEEDALDIFITAFELVQDFEFMTIPPSEEGKYSINENDISRAAFSENFHVDLASQHYENDGISDMVGSFSGQVSGGDDYLNFDMNLKMSYKYDSTDDTSWTLPTTTTVKGLARFNAYFKLKIRLIETDDPNDVDAVIDMTVGAASSAAFVYHDSDKDISAKFVFYAGAAMSGKVENGVETITSGPVYKGQLEVYDCNNELKYTIKLTEADLDKLKILDPPEVET